MYDASTIGVFRLVYSFRRYDRTNRHTTCFAYTDSSRKLLLNNVENQTILLNTRMIVIDTNNISMQLSTRLFKRSEVNDEGSWIEDVRPLLSLL